VCQCSCDKTRQVSEEMDFLKPSEAILKSNAAIQPAGIRLNPGNPIN